VLLTLCLPESIGGSKPRVATSSIVTEIQKYKQKDPSIFAWKIREKLLKNKVASVKNMPSISSINRVLRQLSHRSDKRGESAATTSAPGLVSKVSASAAETSDNNSPSLLYSERNLFFCKMSRDLREFEDQARRETTLSSMGQSSKRFVLIA